jgi:UDP-2-acetamido-2,6-beta-L-arabino-hexul-4-ose reductase
MKILVTGAEGFIGKNLTAQLSVISGVEILRHGRKSTDDDLLSTIGEADWICHLAGVNRPEDEGDFKRVNEDFTRTLCDLVQASGRPVPIIFASSVHVKRDNAHGSSKLSAAYGASKLAAEAIIIEYSQKTGVPVYIFRLPHVIGKWCRPNYNSVIATFCYNIARDLPIRVDDPSYQLNLVYIDDLVDAFYGTMLGDNDDSGPYREVTPTYPITVGELADQIRAFKDSRTSLISEPVGVGRTRVLNATYLSYLPIEALTVPLVQHADERGVFVEMLKTHDSGQFSFFTAHPGVTRGGHYHHSKSEKFLVIKGKARFRFQHILTDEQHEVFTSGDEPMIVETIPGWAHDITNVGDSELIVMLWANEVFDRDRPDTYSFPL